MSSQAYVYIPNLVGRQVLRIPREEADSTEQPKAPAPTPKLSFSTASSMLTSRVASRSTSVSVESVDELE